IGAAPMYRPLLDVPISRLTSITAPAAREKDYAMSSKKFMSTVLLFAVFLGFLWAGIEMLSNPHKDGETIVYAILILGCAFYALICILLLPRKKQG
ncbi:MAG TPA: hypothetical protein VKB35_00805, partial [Ktedonobacteraceae bacterium]|nr:hypothetical protein [Ktedonobacteraceae bacterium]